AMLDETPIARAALWALPAQPVPTDVVLIEADWSDRDFRVGRALLGKTHELARGLGSKTLSHSVDSPPGPPQYQEYEDARIRLLGQSGYELLRDGLRWRYLGSPSAPGAPSLRFRSLSEVGEQAFVNAMASTYHGTIDSWITRTTKERGLLGAARA